MFTPVKAGSQVLEMTRARSVERFQYGIKVEEFLV
jgi:hypothetical protein